MTTIAPASDFFEIKENELELVEPIESHTTERLKQIYQENKEYGRFLIKHGYFFLGVGRPDEDIVKAINEGKIPSGDNYCFSISQYAVKEFNRLKYVEGWLDDGNKLLRHGFCLDNENKSVIDLSIYNNDQLANKLDEYSEEEIRDYFKGLQFFGVVIPEDKINWESGTRNQLEKVARGLGIEDPTETLEFMNDDGQLEGRKILEDD